MPKPDRMPRRVSALMVAALLAVAACGGGGGEPGRYGGGPAQGIVAFYGGWIGVIDSVGQSVSEPHLAGRLGTPGSPLLDVVITPDGRTALTTSFSDNMVSIFDMSDPSAPGPPDNVVIGFSAEDIAITPNGRYALVTDGSVTRRIAVIDVAGRALAENFISAPGPDGYTAAHQAVAVAADGRTVLTVDYFSGKVNTLLLDPAGNLTHVGTIDISPDNTLRPVNVSISPDGRTAIVAAVASGDNTADRVANMGFPVLRITGPGSVAWAGRTAAGGDFVGAQSIAFAPDGSRAYAYCSRPDPSPPTDNTDDPSYPWDAVVVLDVTGPGAVSNSGTAVPVGFRHTGQLFGVDTLAVAPGGRDLYVSNMNPSLASNRIQVVDLETQSVVKTIGFDNAALPMGIYFPDSFR